MQVSFYENLILEDYKSRGYEAIKCDYAGLPDFFFRNPKTHRQEFVEVKVNFSRVRRMQKIVMTKLRKCGFTVKVIRIKTKKPMYSATQKQYGDFIYWIVIEK